MKSKLPAFLIAGLFLGLAACGGGDDAPAPTPPPSPPPPPAGTVIGPTGGTVTGPSGTSVVIPAGALATNTTINIAASPPGGPVLPGSFTVAGQKFDFTPHGTTFAVPVTVTIPLDPALIPAGQTPVLYKTNAQNQWTEVVNATVGANTISGQVTSFSTLVGGLLRNDPERTWQFLTISGDTHQQSFVAGSPGTVPVGVLLEKPEEFGPNILDDVLELAPPALPTDLKANGWVMSTPNGVTYEVFAESPDGRYGQPVPIGSITTFKQSQSYIKRADNARLTYTLTKILIDTLDLNPFFNDRRFTLTGAVELSAKAHLNATPSVNFHARSGIAAVRGNGHQWFSIFGNDPDIGGQLWDRRHFLPLFTEPYIYTTLSSQTECPGTHASLTLKQPITYSVDVSHLNIGDEFTLEMQADAATENNRGGGVLFDCQGGYISAMLRDPAGFGGGTIEFSGLEPTNNPVPGTGVAPLEPPAACLPGPGPDPAAGVLQFSAGIFESAEGAFVPAVIVTRSGGSTGVVTATYSTSDGTAVAGVDYTATTRTVSFADGEDGDRFVSVPLLPDEVSGESDKTVNLTLSQPGGCAALGAQTTAVLTIFDDDAASSFTVGGTVTGLIGTGLTLQDHHFDTLTPANGPFTFRFPTTTGSPYEVTITAQPTNPVQRCLIGSGSGIMGTVDVTNVTVTCAAPPPPGGLDPEFGGGTGKVSTAFGGDETDMLIQSDGKIILIGGSSSNFVMARYKNDGSLDETFGDAGLVTTDVAGGADAAYAGALVAEDKIIVVGSARVGSSDDFAIVRYLANGTVDTTFGTQGKTTTDFLGTRDRAFAVAIQPDNSIVVAGDTIVAGNSDFAIARFDANGVIDNSFGGDGNGKRITSIERVDIAKNVVIESGGTILVTGTTTLGSSPLLGTTGLARYSSAGLLDSSLGTSGTLSIPNMQLGEGLALQPDGKILVAGYVAVAGDIVFGLMRLGTNGFPDLDFGSGGLATAGFTTQDDYARDVTLDAQGRILLSGQASNLSNPDFAVARFSSTGVLDGSFDGDGKFTVDFFGSFDGAENVAVQADGKVVLGGFATNASAVRYGLARFNP